MRYEADVVIIGGGLAGIVTAFELLDHNKNVLILDRDVEEKFGGLAKISFGGICMVGTPHQQKANIPDTPELALQDWLRYGELGAEDVLPRQWAETYCHRSRELIFDWLDDKGVEFLSVVNWPERGFHVQGNTVPRWHITWGTGFSLIEEIVNALNAHPNRSNLDLKFGHRVENLIVENNTVKGCAGKLEDGSDSFEAYGETTVVAAGGVCGGDLSRLRKLWYKPWGDAPEHIVNGAHPYGDGMLHDAVKDIGGNLTHLDRQWHYASGIQHPKEGEGRGLSLVPPRSALWVNAVGQRIGPPPLIGYTDTRYIVEQILQQPGKFSWQIMNWKIAIKELGVSGSEYMRAFRDKSKLKLVMSILLGNKDLVNELIDTSQDIVTADSLPELVEKMNAINLGHTVDLQQLKHDIESYDAEIERGPRFFYDEQLRRIMNFRTYRGDRLRTCKFQPILDQNARPLIAIREFILSRKSLGGIQTNLKSEVLTDSGQPIPGLYAVGEAAGFGGGGIHGIRSLEGTFLGGCVLTGRIAGQAIAGKL